MLPAARDVGSDAIVIACFDDTGLAEMQAAAHSPVFGIGQSAFQMASLLGKSFEVLTSLPISVPVILIKQPGLATQGVMKPSLDALIHFL